MDDNELVERLFGCDWQCLTTLLPDGWQDAAKELGAFCWGRQIKSPEDLLRVCLVYALDGFSLRTTAAWAEQTGLVGGLSDVSLLRRLSRSHEWLSWIVEHKLAKRVERLAWSRPWTRVLLLDATVVTKPGSTGTDWRIHLRFNLGEWQIEGVDLTDGKGGETLKRLDCSPGDIGVGDRIYANRPGIHAVAKAGAHVVVRMTWQNLPLVGADNEPFNLLEHLRTLEPGQAGSWCVQTEPDQKRGIPAIPGRVVAVRMSEEAAEKSRQELRRASKKKGHTPSKESLEAAGYMFIFTTLPPENATTQQVLELYRFRWQVELAFKRMKSIVHLDQMAAKSTQLCRTFLLAKLLIVLLIEDFAPQHCRAAFSPWGYGIPRSVVTMAALPSAV